MNTISTRFAIATAVLVAGIGITGATVAQGGEPQDTGRQAGATTPAETPPDTARVRATHEQHGTVLEGTGSAGGRTVTVYVYENDVHGNSAQVVLGDPADDRIGAVEQEQAFVVDGMLTASVAIEGRSATITGTVSPSGAETTRVDPALDSEPTVVRGTHTPLDADLVVTYGGTTVPLQVSPAFAYDLVVRG